MLLSTKNQIETHRNEINERLARLEKEQNSSLENKIAFENQQRQLQDQLERLNSE